MTQKLQHESRMQMKVNRRHDDRQGTPLGAPPQRILREIAFVLKMTERVRDEIEVAQPEEELVEV
jgi:hypothetical protein